MCAYLDVGERAAEGQAQRLHAVAVEVAVGEAEGHERARAGAVGQGGDEGLAADNRPAHTSAPGCSSWMSLRQFDAPVMLSRMKQLTPRFVYLRQVKVGIEYLNQWLRIRVRPRGTRRAPTSHRYPAPQDQRRRPSAMSKHHASIKKLDVE